MTPADWEPRWNEAEAAAAGAVREEEADAAPPYRGLARFEPDDRHLFFGRDPMVEDLRRLVCDQRLAVLFGPSGSGKSSLLRAWLIPRLREAMAEHGHPAVLRVFTPGARPAETYGHLLTPAEDEPESWVVVDQFEEVFTLCRDLEERARFIEMLLSAGDPDRRLKVLISVRADFYARCAEHRDLADALSNAGLLLGPMTADELREAVVKPAQEVGLLVERELTARIVEEVDGRPGGLPMLSHVLLETWRRRKGRLLTLAAYEAAGGVGGAIAATAEEVYGELTADRARTARHLLLRMVEPGQGTTPDTRRPLTRAELQDYPNPDVRLVVDRLALARLLTIDEDGVQLAHEALITCWPRLSEWIEEDRERLRHHRRLAEVAHAWQEHGRDPGALYRGTALTRAENLFPDGDLLTATEQAFLTAALDARDTEQRAAARTARRSRALLTALSAVLATALVVSLAAWSPFDKVLLSPDGHTLATARLSGTRCTLQLRSTRDGHVLRTLPTPALPVSRDPHEPVDPTDTRPLMAFDADGTTFAHGVSTLGSQTSPQRLTLWDIRHDRAGDELDMATAATDPVVALAIGPSGHTVYADRVGPSGDLDTEIWDTARAHRTRVLTGATDSGPALAVSPDGRLLVGDNRRATLPSGPMNDRDLVLGGEVGALAFSADGSHLAAGAGAGRVALWDGRLRQRAGILRNVFPASLGPTPESVSAVAFSPDGRTLAVGGDAGTLQLWDTATQQPLGDPLTTPGEAVDSLSFSPEGTTVYAAGAHVPLQRYVIAPGRAVTEVCARAGGAELTRAEWRTHVSDVPYRKVCGR